MNTSDFEPSCNATKTFPQYCPAGFMPRHVNVRAEDAAANPTEDPTGINGVSMVCRNVSYPTDEETHWLWSSTVSDVDGYSRQIYLTRVEHFQGFLGDDTSPSHCNSETGFISGAKAIVQAGQGIANLQVKQAARALLMIHTCSHCTFPFSLCVPMVRNFPLSCLLPARSGAPTNTALKIQHFVDLKPGKQYAILSIRLQPRSLDIA